MDKKSLRWWFGNDYEENNGKICFHHFIDDDTITIITKKIKILNQKYVLLLDNNKGCYLKNNSVLEVIAEEGASYLIKLTRSDFEKGFYTFSFYFKDTHFLNSCTFDDLVDLAKDQDVSNDPIEIPLIF